MNDLRIMGGISALIGALTYIVGFALAMTLLAPVWDLEPAQYVAFLADNQTLMIAWHLIIYLINAVFLVILVIALHERLNAGASGMMKTATAFGLIWAGLVIASGMLIINDLAVIADLYSKDPVQATSASITLSAVEDGLGGAVELPGGLWILLVSWVALQVKRLPKALNYLGILIGVAGIVTVIPALYEAGTIFGLGFIVWFTWVGIVLLRNGSDNISESYTPISSQLRPVG
ncbi:MAG: DUF4386 family protein [Chloroflexota bacterium]